MRPRIPISLAFSLLAISGCKTYDTTLLDFSPSIDAAVDTMTTPAQQDARTAEDASARVIDSGRPDARQPDAAVNEAADGGAEDASLDSGIESDAGCKSKANPDGDDCCPDDPDKTDHGTCGCGVPDTDTDHDEVIDCMDGCPHDADKTEPGTCGCGLQDQDSAEVASCVGIRDALVHRYRFDGDGTRIADTVGGADGTAVNAVLTGTGSITLAGGTSDQYVDLPNALLSTLTNATIETWLTWSGGAKFQRVFDFGDTMTAAEGAQETARSSLFLTPATDTGSLRATLRDIAGAETSISGTGLATGTLKHVAMVVDDTHDLLSVYVDGALTMSTALTAPLSSIHDINNWIGRSQFMVDDELGGAVHEFRIYDAALSPHQLATSFAAGPDPAFLPK